MVRVPVKNIEAYGKNSIISLNIGLYPSSTKPFLVRITNIRSSKIDADFFDLGLGFLVAPVQHTFNQKGTRACLSQAFSIASPNR